MPYSQEQLDNRRETVAAFNQWVKDVYALNRKAQPPRKSETEKLLDMIKAMADKAYQLDDCAVDLDHKDFKQDFDALVAQMQKVRDTKSGKSVATLMYKMKSGIEAKDVEDSLNQVYKLFKQGTELNKARKEQEDEIEQLLRDTVDKQSYDILHNILKEPFQSTIFGTINEVVSKNIKFNVSPESFDKKIDIKRLDEEYFGDAPVMKREAKQHQVDSQQLVSDALIAMKAQLHQYVTEYGDDLFFMEFHDINRCYATLDFCACLKKYLELQAYKDGDVLGADDIMPLTAAWLRDNVNVENLNSLSNLERLPELLAKAGDFLRGEGVPPKASDEEIGAISYDITNITSSFIVALEQKIFEQLDMLEPKQCSNDLQDLIVRKNEQNYSLSTDDLGIIYGEFMTDKNHADLKNLSGSLQLIQSKMGIAETPNLSLG